MIRMYLFFVVPQDCQYSKEHNMKILLLLQYLYYNIIDHYDV